MRAADFAPCEIQGANSEIWHGRLFTAATAPIGGMSLAALYSAWAGGTENIFEILHFYPFGVPIAPTVLGVGGTRPSQVWCGGRPIIGP